MRVMSTLQREVQRLVLPQGPKGGPKGGPEPPAMRAPKGASGGAYGSYGNYIAAWLEPRSKSTPTSEGPGRSGQGTPSNIFMRGLGPACTLAQWFSLLPVAKPTTYEDASFRWKSFRVAYAFFVILGSFVESVFSLLRMMETGITFATTVNAMFYSTSLTTSIIFLNLSIHWKDTFTLWTNIERSAISCNGEPPRLVISMVAITIIILAMAALEHVLSIGSTLTLVWPCYDRGGYSLLIEGYYLTKYRKTFTTVRYSLLRGTLLLVLQVITTFIWNFCDLLIILVSMGLSASFRQLNRAMDQFRGKAHIEEFWREKRETFNTLAILTRTMSDYIGPIVLISYASNLYFICLQLLIVTQRQANANALNNIYFFFSFFYLVARTLVLSLVAAEVCLESQKSKPILFSVQPTGYCREVRRFLMQVNTDSVAISGCNFFSITRSFILTVAGTIVTYMVILVQFDSASETEHAVQPNSSIVACTCADLQVYDC